MRRASRSPAVTTTPENAGPRLSHAARPFASRALLPFPEDRPKFNKRLRLRSATVSARARSASTLAAAPPRRPKPRRRNAGWSNDRLPRRKIAWRRLAWDSNPSQQDYKSCALTTELAFGEAKGNRTPDLPALPGALPLSYSLDYPKRRGTHRRRAGRASRVSTSPDTRRQSGAAE